MTGHRSYRESVEDWYAAMTPEQFAAYQAAYREVQAEERANAAICGHCHRPAIGYANANGIRLCHTGTVPMEDEPTDCYRMVIVSGHAADGSCCRTPTDASP